MSKGLALSIVLVTQSLSFGSIEMISDDFNQQKGNASAITELNDQIPTLNFAYITNFLLLALMLASFVLNGLLLKRDLKEPLFAS